MSEVSRSANQQGIALIEVLITGVILAVAVVGLALMLSGGLQSTVAGGDTRVALHLAQQKVEKLTGLGYSAIQVADRTNGDGVTNGCAVNVANNEPCYNETFSPTSATGLGLGNSQRFTRLTCVRTVRDDNPELPADPVQPPSSWTCPSCTQGDPGTDPNNCGPTSTTTCCSGQTKRVKVAVIPILPDAGDATSQPVDPYRVTLEAVVTSIVKP
jgi:hypothetical protein